MGKTRRTWGRVARDLTLGFPIAAVKGIGKMLGGVAKLGKGIVKYGAKGIKGIGKGLGWLGGKVKDAFTVGTKGWGRKMAGKNTALNAMRTLEKHKKAGEKDGVLNRPHFDLSKIEDEDRANLRIKDQQRLVALEEDHRAVFGRRDAAGNLTQEGTRHAAKRDLMASDKVKSGMETAALGEAVRGGMSRDDLLAHLRSGKQGEIDAEQKAAAEKAAAEQKAAAAEQKADLQKAAADGMKPAGRMSVPAVEADEEKGPVPEADDEKKVPARKRARSIA